MEIWKDIKGYEGIYQASNTGKIRSLDREKECFCKETGEPLGKRKIKGRVLTGGKDKNGYTIGVFHDHEGVRRTLKFHRLIAETFLPNPDIKSQVNHRDGNKSNNRIDNLEWNTPSENVKHAFTTGLKQSQFQLEKRAVVQIDPKTDEIIRVYESAKSATKDGFHRQSVGGCCRGERGRRIHKGYKWKFLSDVDRSTTSREA